MQQRAHAENTLRHLISPHGFHENLVHAGEDVAQRVGRRSTFGGGAHGESERENRSSNTSQSDHRRASRFELLDPGSPSGFWIWKPETGRSRPELIHHPPSRPTTWSNRLIESFVQRLKVPGSWGGWLLDQGPMRSRAQPGSKSHPTRRGVRCPSEKFVLLASAKGSFMRASRQLRRWGISESRLPQGSIVRYQDPSLWALYRGYVAGGVLILGVMSLTWGLLLQRAGRRRVELSLDERLKFESLLSNLSATL